MLLKRGNAGNGVAVVQFALNGVTSFMPKLQSDGIFGAKTEERVRQHQSQKRLKPDGIVGAVTLDSLFEIVKLKGSATFKPNEAAARAALTGPLRSLVPNRQPSLGPLLSPAMAEFLRHQQAFMEWMARPVPKPPLPVPAAALPRPGPFGPVFLPVAHQRINLPGPPANRGQVQFGVPIEGNSVTISVKGEASADIVKGKFKEAVWGYELDWVVLKGNIAKFSVTASRTQNNEGKFTGEVEVSLIGGSGLTLQTKLGQLGVLKFVPYLATAVTSEHAAQASGGFKLSADLSIPIGGHMLEASAGLKGGSKLAVGPVELPDGSVEHQFVGMPFGSTIFVSAGFVF